MKRTYGAAFSPKKAPRVALKAKRPKVATVKAVKQMIAKAEEVKSLSNYTDINVTTAGSVIDLSAIPQGFNKNQRVGDKVELKKLLLRWKADINAGGSGYFISDPWVNVRCIVFRWNEDSTVSTPSRADILNVIGNDVTLNLPNFDGKAKYHVLLDKQITLYASPAWDGTSVKSVDGVYSTKFATAALWGSRLGRKGINYLANTTDGKYKLYALLVSDSTYVPHPGVEFQWQLTYTDA